MGVIKKQAFQSSVLLYTGTIIGFITTGLMVPHLLSKSEIGTLRLLQSYSSIFVNLGILGFTTVTIRFIPRFWNEYAKNHRGFLGLIILMGLVGSLVATVLILIIEPMIIENNLDKSPLFARYFILIIPLTVFQIFYSQLDVYNTALLKSSYGVFLRDFVQRILILIGLTFVFLKLMEFDIYIYYFVAALSAPTVFVLIYIIRNKVFDWRIDTGFLKMPLITSMASVGIFGLLNSFSQMAVMQIDTIMLNMYYDSSLVGIYAITFYFGTLVLIPAKALNRIAPPLISQAYKDNDLSTVKDVYYRSTGSLFIIGILIYTGLLVNLDNIFFIIPKSYEAGKLVIVFIGLSNLVKMSGGTNDSVINYSKYYRMTTLFLVTLIFLIIAFNFILIPPFGINGAAAASFFAILIHNLIKFLFIRSKFGMNPYNLQFLAIAIISISVYFLVSIIPDPDHFILDILVDSFLAILLFYVSARHVPLFSEIDSMIHQVYKRLVKIFHSKIKW